MLMMKTQLKQQGENTGLKSELTELRKESAEMKTDIHKLQTKLQLVEKENTGLKSELIDLRQVVSSSMDPQLKDQVVNTFKLGSIEEDVQQNQEDIINLRINDGHDMQISQMLNQISNINTTLNGEIVKLDERLEKQLTNMEDRLTNVEDLGSGLQQVRSAICGYKKSMSISWYHGTTTLTFDRVYDEVNSGGDLEESGYFTATIEGVYLVTLKTSVALSEGEYLRGSLKLSSGQYDDNYEDVFIDSWNHEINNGGNGYIVDQASASRYVRMAAGETLHISLNPNDRGDVEVNYTTMCVSLYSASG